MAAAPAPHAAATIGNLVLQDFVGVVGELRQSRRKVQSVVAVDEFGALSGEQLGRLLSTARDVGLPTMLAGQDLAQLRRVSEHFEAEVKANISALLAHRQSEPDSADQIARICGTEEVIQQTQQIDRLRSRCSPVIPTTRRESAPSTTNATSAWRPMRSRTSPTARP